MAIDMNELAGRVAEIVKKVQENDKLMERFKKEPVDTVKELLGDALTDELLDAVVDGVKAKIGADTLSDLFSAAKKLF